VRVYIQPSEKKSVENNLKVVFETRRLKLYTTNSRRVPCVGKNTTKQSREKKTKGESNRKFEKEIQSGFGIRQQVVAHSVGG
jgi:hypothetical protein